MFTRFGCFLLAQLLWALPTCSLLTPGHHSPSRRLSTTSGGGSNPVAATWYASWHSSEFTLQNVSWPKYSNVIYAFASTTPDVNVLGLCQILIKRCYPSFVQAAHGNARDRLHVISTNDTANFLSFLQTLRSQDGAQNLIISAAVSVKPFVGSDGNPMTDVSGLRRFSTTSLYAPFDQVSATCGGQMGQQPRTALMCDGTVANGIEYVFDNCSKTVMVSYDDAASFAAKGHYIKDAGLAGFVLWQAGGDSRDILLDAIKLADCSD
ncbi:hypothetical protein EDB84DRAFT_1646970 [Lactarius hengduanensis]|nr:hypothetical protein EDB84DRAFT_1646970 [Lactarius hengduanensis]